MKPPPFHYHDPRSLDDALGLLADKENTKLLAGGQSLMPMLNMRFVFPDDVIDLNRITELASIGEDDGRIRIGAMTRQSSLERSELIRNQCPIIIEALRQVGHLQTRNRGTIGGSLCHLDPSAELPTVAQGLDATIHVQNKRGTRTLTMADFPAFFMTPAIEPDEIVTAIEFEPWPQGHGFAFVEFARRHGDFAIVALAAVIDNDRVTLGVGGVADRPVSREFARQDDPSEALNALAWSLGAEDDAHATAAYRRQLIRELGRELIAGGPSDEEIAHARQG